MRVPARSAMSAVAFVIAFAVASTPLPAAAYVAPGAQVLSASLQRLEQGDDATTQVALSGDGRFAAFQTRARNFFADDDADPAGAFRQGGIFRRDLTTGALELVAYGDVRSEANPDTVLVRGAQNPSLSGDGRYVAFSTGAALVPEDTNGNVDVYVRDMARTIGDPAAYDVVSARDGSALAATYEPRPPLLDKPGLNPGAELTGRGAISADGRLVVFRTPAPSDLPAAAGPVTDAQQVFLRDRLSNSTRLVTRVAGTGAPAGGASGAVVLSADGSTVSWVGRNAPRQTRFVPGESSDDTFDYYLWQRVADGPSAPTERVTGIADTADPGCPAPGLVIDDPGLTGPCYGPLAQTDGYFGGIAAQAPALSADGRRVAYLTNASARAQPQAGVQGDLWLADMSTGVTRKAGAVELTREGASDAASGSALDSVAISGDGRWAAVTTVRTTFVLPALRLLGTPRAQAIFRDLYLVDLEGRTIERILRASDGTDPNGSVNQGVSLSSDGRRIAFVSSASNFLFGDANDRADAFVVDRSDAPPAEPPAPDPGTGQATEAPPTAPAVSPPPGRLVVTARARRGGRVTLTVRAETRGRLTATVRGRLPNASGTPAGPPRTLASAERAVRSAARVTVTVTLARRYRAQLRSTGRITAQAQVRLVAPNGRTYERRVTVEFRS